MKIVTYNGQILADDALHPDGEGDYYWDKYGELVLRYYRPAGRDVVQVFEFNQGYAKVIPNDDVSSIKEEP